MSEPILRISISPWGLIKVDALISTDVERTELLEFYASIFSEIRALDGAIRSKQSTIPLKSESPIS